MSNYNPDYISLFSNSEFRRNVIKRKGVSREQLLAYRDFQDNFTERMSNVESQFQMPIEKKLTKAEIVNLYSAHYKGEFTPKQFSQKTGMKASTARKELSNGVKRGILERKSKGVYEYK
jgi:Fic family protein